MKKISLSFVLFLSVFCIQAQFNKYETNRGQKIESDLGIAKPKLFNSAQKVLANDTFQVAHFFGASDTSRFMWDFNLNYSNDNDLKWAMTLFDTLHDSYGNSKSYSAVQNTIVDSIFILCGHKKNSPTSVTDSVIIELYDISSGIFVVWDTIIESSTYLGSSNNWLQSFVLRVPCHYTFAPNQKFGVRVGFAGPPSQDTFGIVVGFNNQGACGSSSVSAKRSDIPFNTYRMYAKVDTSLTSGVSFAYDFIYPSGIWNGIFFRDCNANGSYDSGSNEEEVFQSAYIFCDVILADVIISVSEGALTSGLSVFPNPSNGSFTVNMDLGTAVDMNISVTDLQGKEVYTESISNTSNFSRNLDLTHLNKGVYIFRATTETGSAVQKIVIN